MAIRLIPKRLIGQTIHGIRTRLGMSPAEFARSLGVDDAREVGRWERGTAQPDYGTLAKIATMGVVDVLVFHEAPAVDGRPQLTPGEASELGQILARMEALLAEARRLVERASNRTAVEFLDAATGSGASLPAGDGLVLDASVRVEAKPRTRSRTASAGGGATRGGTGSSRTGRSSAGSSTGGSSSAAKSSGAKSTGSSAAGTKTGGARSASSRAGGSSSRASSTALRSSGGSSAGGSSSGGSTSGRSTSGGAAAGGSSGGASS
ncbi:MAG TPA: helix-turn-helix transcriptional regulator [Longimicrobium sp.]|nr:helix-turn-helix transcriptional regulator [Longimicrobium sp.]